jgi:hypothetical protein
MKPALALMAVEVAQDLEDQDLEDQGVAEEDMAEEDVAEEDMAEEDAISKRHSDIRTVAIISSM